MPEHNANTPIRKTVRKCLATSSKHWRRLLQFGFLGIFLMIIGKMIDPVALRQIIAQVRPEIMLVAIAIYFGNIAIRAYRWQRIFSVKTRAISLKDAYVITLVGVALNMIIPATMGDVARSYYGYKLYGFKEEMLSTVLADKMFALCSLFVLGGISGYGMGYGMLGTVSWFVALMAGLPIVFPRLVPWGWLNGMLRYMKKSLDAERLIEAFTLPAGLKLGMFGVSFGGWLWTCVFFYVVCAAFPVQVSLWYVIVIMPMLTIARLFPFTLNALGPMEVAVAYFFHLIGIEPTLAVLISLSSNLISSVLPGICGMLILIFWRQAARKDAHVKSTRLHDL